jgi:hypothetical protein
MDRSTPLRLILEFEGAMLITSRFGRSDLGVH